MLKVLRVSPLSANSSIYGLYGRVERDAQNSHARWIGRAVTNVYWFSDVRLLSGSDYEMRSKTERRSWRPHTTR